MKHFITLLLLLTATTLLGEGKFRDNYYKAEVYDMQAAYPAGTDKAIIADVYAFVYDAGTKTLSTLYSDTQRTSLANPITRTQFASDDAVKFYSASATHDVVLFHADGSMSKHASVALSTGRLYMDRSGPDKVMVIPFDGLSADATEVDSGLDVPLNSVIYDVIVEVVTVDATETCDIGLLSSETAGDANGLAALVSVATAGFIRLYSVTDGSNEDFVAAPYSGALMGLGSAGTDAANDFGQAGGPGHVVTGSNAQSVTYTCSSGTDTAAGYVYVFYKELR